ncbi:FAD-dependent monooxygenase [Roseivirga sp. BDSF3-8]|uniref:FAD-dependent monooxygenase n=1 Tax=Roseivirga sp. BDSF3-8 TaxID=3241598 RepID=UPI003531994E
MTMVHTHYKVVIAGGGPAGAALAIHLLQAGIGPVLIAEAEEYTARRAGESIPSAATPLLAKLGIPVADMLTHHHPSQGIQACWGSDTPAHRTYTTPGWHLSRPAFDSQLARAAGKQGATLLQNTRVFGAKSEMGVWQLCLHGEHARICTADFVVDATGRKAYLAEAQGATRRVDHHLLGYYAWLPADTQSPVTLIEAVENGWWYMAALPGQKAAVAFMTHPETGRRLEVQKPEDWYDLLLQTTTIKKHLLSHSRPEKISVHAAHSQELDKKAGFSDSLNGWLACGDAASAYDPLSGQGITKALETSAWACHAIRDYFSGRYEGLETYNYLLKGTYRNYHTLRRQYYREEGRWPHADFWQQVHEYTPSISHLTPLTL